MPSSLRDDGWVGWGSLALKELPAEISLLSARTGALEALSMYSINFQASGDGEWVA